MPKFGASSRRRLATCHPDLQCLMRRVVAIRDISVVGGHRNEGAQNAAFAAGKSKLQWPKSKHNASPSLAVDIVPWPERYTSAKTMRHVAGIVLGVAAMLGIKVCWGGDWDMDSNLEDNTFNDLWHFELIEEG